MSSTKVQSSWKNVNGVFVKVGGQWKTVTESYVRVNGQWRLTTFSTGPTDAPQMTHDGFGRFRIVNPQPNLIYEAEFVGGNNRFPGSIQFSNNVFTLGSDMSAYNVYSRFVANGPRSPAGYMERRRITFTFIAQCNYIQQTCFREINEDYAATPVRGTLVGDQTNCFVHPCFNERRGPNSNNDCFCFEPLDGRLTFIGKGACPAGWYNCPGTNRCCINDQITGYSCPNGGTLSGTTCIKRTPDPYECGYWQSCNNEDSPPSGYNRSPGTANIQGEWWRITR